VGFGALAIASAMNAAPLLVAIPVVVAAAFFLLRLRETSHVKGDSAIALISTGALAVGVTVVSMTTGMNTDVYNYLFGSILSMSGSDVWITVLVSLVVLALFVFFYHRIFAVTFDEDFAKATGTKTEMYNLMIAVVIGVIIVISMKLVGSLLITALVIFPALSAMRVFTNFKSVTIFSAVFSVLCALIGILISIPTGTPVGATIVAMDIIGFGICCLVGRRTSVIG
jgi:zinc transport system permease protein